MDGRSERRTGGQGQGGRLIALAVVMAFAGLASRPAEAGPIRLDGVLVVNDADSLGPSWSRFLAGGEALWAVASPPSFPSGLVLPSNNGKLIDTPFVDYLTWRRLLDPSRFDLNHPSLALSLPAPRSIPAGDTTGSTPKPFNPAPQNLPEPSALALAIVLLGTGFAARRRIPARDAVPEVE